MATLKRKHRNDGSLVKNDSSKRQKIELDPRLAGMEPFHWNEPPTAENLAGPLAITQPVTNSLTPADTDHVAYVIGKNRPDQPYDKSAIVNLHGRKKIVEQCIAFLEKFSPNDNESLVARLVKSPVSSNVDCLEIRSWSTEVQTPDYPAEMELWQKPYSVYSPSVATMSPYPQHVSIVRRDSREFEYWTTPEPERVILIPEFDDIQAGLAALRGRLVDTLLIRDLPTAEEMVGHPSVYALREATSELCSIDFLTNKNSLEDQANATLQIISQCLGDLSRVSTITFMYNLLGLVADLRGSGQQHLWHKILTSMLQSGKQFLNSFFKLIVKSIIPHDLAVSAASRYAQCIVDVASSESDTTNAVVVLMRTQRASLHGLAGEGNSALSVLRELGMIVETSKSLMTDYEFRTHLFSLGCAYFDLEEYDMALGYFRCHIDVMTMAGRYWTVSAAYSFANIASCYDHLLLFEQAYNADLEALNVATYSIDEVSHIQMSGFRHQVEQSYNDLLEHQQRSTTRANEALGSTV